MKEREAHDLHKELIEAGLSDSEARGTAWPTVNPGLTVTLTEQEVMDLRVIFKAVKYYTVREEPRKMPLKDETIQALQRKLNVAKPAKFQFDDIGDEHWAGYTFGEVWNGWECPYFELEEVKSIIEWYRKDGYDSIRYDEAQDSVIVEDDDGLIEKFTGQDITLMDGSVVHVYPLGAFGWCWDLYVPNEEEVG